MSELDLAAFIDEALGSTSECDPHVIARRLLPRLAPEFRDELVISGLEQHVAAQIRRQRVVGRSRRAGMSRWQVVPVCVGGVWMDLGACGIAELGVLAEQHRELAAQNLARAKEYEDLAAAIRTAGVETVGDLWAEQDLAA